MLAQIPPQERAGAARRQYPEFPKELIVGRNMKPDDHYERPRVMVRVMVRVRV